MKTLVAFVLPLALAFAAETRLGKPLTLKNALPVEEVMASPDQYVGKLVQVKGKVSEVCQNAGCWMQLVDPATNKAVRIKVKDGEIVFPKTAIGRMAVAEGTMRKIELSKEQAIAARKHEAEENGKKFDPASVKGPETIYQIAGTGAVIRD